MNITNKVKDKFRIERVLTEDEVKKELELMRSKRVLCGLGVATTGLAIVKYSAIVDQSVINLINFIKNYISASNMSLMGIPIPNYFIIITLLFLLISICYAYKNDMKEGK